MTDSRLPLCLALALAACAQGGNDRADAPAVEGGSCGAAAHQDWIGKRIDVLNDADLPAGTRVLFPTTPATMDYNAARLNVAVDQADIIARVYCG